MPREILAASQGDAPHKALFIPLLWDNRALAQSIPVGAATPRRASICVVSRLSFQRDFHPPPLVLVSVRFAFIFQNQYPPLRCGGRGGSHLRQATYPLWGGSRATHDAGFAAGSGG